MAETATPWLPRGAWAGIAQVGRLGAAGQAGVVARTREGMGIASLIAGRADGGALAAAVRDGLGLSLPLAPAVTRNGAWQALWSGPGQWLLLADGSSGLREALAALSGLAAVSDQSDGRAVLSLSGRHVRDLLAKGVMIDLHSAAFPVGAAALTSIAHLGVSLWRAPDGPDGAVFEVMVARSMAGSFWSWFSASAAEFGCTVSTVPVAPSGRG